ncbi:MAG: hypothetical protein JO286_07400 [Solirubrobacterales bacterium]|nr:hypothetical protein [Solirubrobacterales bacterium]
MARSDDSLERLRAAIDELAAADAADLLAEARTEARGQLLVKALEYRMCQRARVRCGAHRVEPQLDTA